ncbi:MAG: UDP-glucose dehydrogenase family protein [Terriglobia bacterium]
MEIGSQKHSVSIFGLGYVGSVMAACFAHKGHRVVGVDVNPAKVEMLDSGRSPIIEAKVDEFVAEGHRSCRLHATTDVKAAVEQTEVSFVCVGTPSRRNGKLDLTHIENVSREIGAALEGKESRHWVVVRSTILPGTTESVVIPALESASGKRAGSNFCVVYNPEFMREGTAVDDFFKPPYTVLGARETQELAPVRELYDWTPSRIFETAIPVAEMVKYASNAFHAVKVSFANELGTMAKHLGVDAEAVAEIFTSDTRLNISPAYLNPGFAFGGSCLPKDLRALNYSAKELDLRLPLMESVLASNQEHIDRAVDMVLHRGDKNIGLLGLSFKAGTDDLRESPHVELVKRLLGEGCHIKIWDPNVSLARLSGANRQYIEEVIPHIGSLLSEDLAEVLRGAEILILGSRAATKEMLQLRAGQKVLDLVNLEKSSRPDSEAAYEGICW